ncbi:MAG: DNA-binding protein [Desulfoprunum sp.]|nr:DNA-binding protein [Desulfoprunum sp.]
MSFLPEDMAWLCRPCGVQLRPATVELRYLDSVFSVELPACPQCGAVLISEELATGRMLEVEQLLEDK